MNRRSLQREIDQVQPFQSACQEAALGLQHTSDRFRRHYAAVMEPFGVTFQQYNVLKIVRGAGTYPKENV